MHSHEGSLLRRPGFARQARDAAQREAPLEAAYRSLAAAERARLVPELEAAEHQVLDLDVQRVLYQRFVRIEHPEIPRRLNWLEREMDGLSDELYGTRMGLENAMGQDWVRDDPSWAPELSLVGRAFPNSLDLSRDTPHQSSHQHQGPHLERDFGPDLGLGL